MVLFIFLMVVIILIIVIAVIDQTHYKQQIEAEKQRKIEIAKKEEEHKAERLKREAEEKELKRQEFEKKREMARQKILQEQMQEKKILFDNILNSLKRYDIVLSDEKHNRNEPFYPECKNVTSATPIGKIKDFVSVDTETTGLKATGNDIVQLSAVKFKNFEPVEIFSTYIKPRKSIPEEATNVNGITDEMVENSPRFYQIIKSFDEFIGDLPLVAHNAPFDMKHLFANGLDSIENKTVYDTLDLSKRIIKDADSYKLQNICGVANIYFDNAHNSDADSLAAGLLFVYLCAERHELTTEELINMVG